MPTKLPPHLRPMAYALQEMLFDLTYIAQAHWKTDLESVFIMHCVAEATMRPLVLNPGSPDLTVNKPSDDVRGYISRRSIAERTNLSRETVRRKVKELAERDLLMVDSRGRVRSTQALSDASVQRVIRQGHRAVLKYIQRLRAHDIDVEV